MPPEKKVNRQREEYDELPRISEKELGQRFRSLCEKNKYLTSAILLRSALRILPLLGAKGNFDYWIIKGAQNTDKNSEKSSQKKAEIANAKTEAVAGQIFKTPPREGDNRARFLLALIRSAQILWSQLPSKNPNTNELAVAKRISAASAANASSNPVTFTFAYAAAASDFSDFNYAVLLDASLSAVLAHDLSTLFKINYKQFLTDLNHAEENPDVSLCLHKNLWRQGTPDEFKSVYLQSFKPTVERLMAQSVPATKQALQHSLEWYESIVGPELTRPDTFTPIHQATQELAAEKVGAVDALNRDNLVSALASFIGHKDNSSHLTIGLLGHWGSGKSTVIRLLKDRLCSQNNNAYLFGEFNAWAYEHCDNIQAAMGHEVMSSLTSSNAMPLKLGSTKGFNQRIKNTAKRVGAWGKRYIGWSVFGRSWLTLCFAAKKYPVRFLTVVVMSIAMVVAVWLGAGSFMAGDFKLNTDKLELKLATLFAYGGGSIAFIFAWWRQVRVVFAQPCTKEFLTYIKLPSYAKHIGLVSEMRDDIRCMSELRLNGNKRLIFVVDDLDRCSPEGIVKTLEAVRLVLDIEQVVVIIAIDQRIALAALANHYEHIKQHHEFNDAKSIARDYLGKMMQMPVVLPEADLNSVMGYAQHLWDKNSDQTTNAQAEAEQELEEETQINTQWKNLIPQIKSLLAEKENGETQADDQEALEGDTGNEPNIAVDSGEERYFTEEELAQVILKMDIEPVKSVKEKGAEPIIGLTDQQKAAFVYWSDKLGLNNPRKLKRLYNSYNLLLSVNEWNDEPLVDDSELPLGLLIALLTLEFINGQRNHQLRAEYQQVINGLKDIAELEPSGQTALLGQVLPIIDKAALKYLKENKDENKTREQLLKTIRCFVLPAVDCHQDVSSN